MSSVLTEIGVQAREEKEAAKAAYLECIHRHYSPQSGDAERMRDAMRVLGRNQTVVEADIAALNQIADLRRKIVTVDPAKDNELKRVEAELAELQRRFEQQSRELVERQAALVGETHGQRRVNNEARETIRIVKSNFAHLFPDGV